MADKKNIVIKVKYPTPGKISKDDISPPKTITEWNIKRIVIAIAGIVIALISLLLLNTRDTQNTEPANQAAVLPEISAKPSDKPKTGASQQVLRALLTTKVTNNEPVDEITLPLKVSNKGSTWVYYFVELKGMKGKTVYHEWLLDGVLISRKKVNISDEIWRTSSRQVFNYTAETNWTVRLVDEAGEVINEKHFNVIYQ